MPLKLNQKTLVLVVIALATIVWPFTSLGTRAQTTDDEKLFDAVCPIIYPVDQSASDRGYHYLFYGNGFFINSDGYLITAAHVLSQLHGGQPYVLLHQSSSGFRIAQAALVAIDREHDVAVLRITPNPFEGNYKVSYPPLTADRPLPGQTVFSAALLPSRPREAYTLGATLEMRASGEVLGSEFSQLEKGKGDTELLIFGHEVLLGQSGAPVISTESQSVVGLVEGQWFGHNSLAVAAAERQQVGAILPIHYAIALLQQKHIAWYTSPNGQENQQDVTEHAHDTSIPETLSIVPAAYPSQSIFGGEVILDARIDNTGILADIQTIRGEAPYLEKARVSVRTWTFLPTTQNSHANEPRIGIAFDFVPRLAASKAPKTNNYENGPSDSRERSSPECAALPIATLEPEYPPDENVQSSVILSTDINQQGQLDSVKILGGAEPFTTSATAALHQWRFEPAKHLGGDISSRVIIVFTFAQPLVSSRTQSPKSSQ
jgi:Trypsin-like peptidase domain/Gram-negative bacterial TonB protein C-terminal